MSDIAIISRPGVRQISHLIAAHDCGEEVAISAHLRRRRFIVGTMLLAVGSPFIQKVHAAQPMGFEEARHLLMRTSFSAAPARITAFEALEYGTAVDGLLQTGRAQTMTPPPSWIDDSPQEASRTKAEFAAEKRKAKAEGVKPSQSPGATDQRRDLQFWWIDEMLATEHPLVERMVLFWHNHFTSSLKKVKYMPALYRQNVLFRREALGNFATLLKEIARDPAMLIYLDGARSVARQPNENFGRELLELFTLGEGGYAEADIKAAARAFTGWSVSHDGEFAMKLDEHDGGPKSFLGKTGQFDGNDILDILLAHPRTAKTIVEKLWREYVSLEPDEAEVSRLAKIFRDNGYEMKPLLRALFMSAAFRDPANRAALIKSPVDLVIGTTQLLGLPTGDKVGLLRMLQALGQVPFDPPNVKGWPGGERWITSNTLLLRQLFLRRMIEASNTTDPIAEKRRAGKKQDSSQRSGMDDSTMQLAEPSMSNDDHRLSGERMAISLPPRFASIGSATLERALLPCKPIDPISSADPPGAVAAAALLDVTYQLK